MKYFQKTAAIKDWQAAGIGALANNILFLDYDKPINEQKASIVGRTASGALAGYSAKFLYDLFKAMKPNQVTTEYMQY